MVFARIAVSEGLIDGILIGQAVDMVAVFEEEDSTLSLL